MISSVRISARIGQPSLLRRESPARLDVLRAQQPLLTVPLRERVALPPQKLNSVSRGRNIQNNALARAALKLDLAMAGVSAGTASKIQAVVACSSVYAALLIAAYLFIPTQTWRHRTLRSFVGSWWSLVPLAGSYAALLAASWQPDTLSLIMPGSLEAGLSGGFNPQFFPTVDSISQLFAREVTAASLWLHALAVNTACARWIWLQEDRGVISRWTRSIAVFLGALFGPLGVLGLFLGSFVERRLFFWRPKGQWEQYL